MNKEDVYRWLFEHGGPVIRYRTATELLTPDANRDIPLLKEELLQSKQVKTWVGHIRKPVLLLKEPVDTTPPVLQSGISELHGGKSDHLENALGKLSDFGLRKGTPELDRETLPYREWLAKRAENPGSNVFNQFNISMLASFLARTGYVHEHGVQHVLITRLNLVHEFTRNRDYDVYIPGKYLRKHPVIKPEVTPDGVCRLPLIYDIVGWAAYLPKYGTGEMREKADTVIDYILDDAYQNLPWGYGIMSDGTGRTWSLGWSVHVPRYFNVPEKKYMNRSVVQMMSLLAEFKAARQHPWFTECLDHLESFKTEKGTYLFPADYLEEKTNGYWVMGVRMGLEENRKRNLELESTFRMAKLHKIISEKI